MSIKSIFRTRPRPESGLAAVELAVVLPLLVILLFGIVEFSHAYGFQNDVRSAANTAARIGADTDGTVASNDVKDLICGSLDVQAVGSVTFDLSLSPSDPGLADPPGSRGSIGRVVVNAQYLSFTGFFDAFTTIRITETVDFAVINPADTSAGWWPASTGFTCT